MKALAAFGLGLVSFFLFMFVGESVSLAAGFVATTAYFFVCQCLLSRGNPDAHREDWTIMFALDGVMLAVAVLVFVTEKQRVVESQVPGMILSTCGGTYAGAALASLMARRAPAFRGVKRVDELH